MKVNLKIKPEKLHYLGMLVLLAILFFFLWQRLEYKLLPEGDEGSWMSTAAELSRGNGFATNWLEFPFQSPYSLPRSDDFRYPALVFILGGFFKIFGIHYGVALWAVAVIYLLSCFVFYLLIKKLYGTSTALLSLLLACISPLQLFWNSQVYSEGLFFLGLCAFVYYSHKIEELKPKYFFLLGLSVGILYLIRPNGLICLLGMVSLVPKLLRQRKKYSIFLLIMGLGFAIPITPWLIRNYMAFDYPLHFANSSAIFMGNVNDPVEMSALEYFHKYGFFFQFKRMFLGTLAFFKGWMLYDEGLFIIPFTAVSLGIFKRPLLTPVAAYGFWATFLICLFMSYSLRDAAVRYFSPFAPFFMAHGIHQLVLIFKKQRDWLRKLPSWSRVAVLGLILILPVVNPHRFYFRKFQSPNPEPQGPILEYKKYFSEIIGDKYYLGRYLCQLNYELEGKCIGIQSRGEKRILEAIPKALKKLEPKFMSLTAEEVNSSLGARIMAKIDELGFEFTEVFKNSFATIYNLAPKK